MGQDSRRKRGMKRYYEHKAKGICTSCKKNKAQEGILICRKCNKRQKSYDRNKRYKLSSEN